jgi:predicted GIY-YIG superfamily endonuclease
MVNYTNGKVYRLCCGDRTLYIGSTAQPLSVRMSGHRRHKTSKFFGREDVRIVLIEAWPCANRDELRRREQHYIDHAEALFPNVELRNEVRAYATPEDKKAYDVRYNATEKRAVSKKRFYDTKKGKDSRAWFKQRVTCTCGRTILRGSISTHGRSDVHRRWQGQESS